MVRVVLSLIGIFYSHIFRTRHGNIYTYNSVQSTISLNRSKHTLRTWSHWQVMLNWMRNRTMYGCQRSASMVKNALRKRGSKMPYALRRLPGVLVPEKLVARTGSTRENQLFIVCSYPRYPCRLQSPGIFAVPSFSKISRVCEISDFGIFNAASSHYPSEVFQTIACYAV